MSSRRNSSASSERSNFSGLSSCSSSNDSKYNLRTKSIQNRIEVERRQIEPRSPKPKQRPAPLSKYRRRTANFRERCRMQEMNNAFKRLQSVVPGLFLDSSKVDSTTIDSSKVTKISTLKLAVDYISALTAMLNSQNEQQLNVHSNNNNNHTYSHNGTTILSDQSRMIQNRSRNVYYDSSCDESSQHFVRSNVNTNPDHPSQRVISEETSNSLPIIATSSTPFSYVSHNQSNPLTSSVLQQDQSSTSSSSNSPEVIAHQFNYLPYQTASQTRLSHSQMHHQNHHQNSHHSHHPHHHHLHSSQHQQTHNHNGRDLQAEQDANGRIQSEHHPPQHESFTRLPIISNNAISTLSNVSSILTIDDHSVDCTDFFDHQTDLFDELGELIDTFSDDLL